MRVQGRLALLVGVPTAALLLFAAFAFLTLDRVKVNGPLYAEVVQGKDLIADILPPPSYIIESFLLALQLQHDEGAVRTAELIARIEVLKKDFATRHAYWDRELPPGEIRKLLLEDAYFPALDFFRIMDLEYLPAIGRHDLGAARRICLLYTSPSPRD